MNTASSSGAAPVTETMDELLDLRAIDPARVDNQVLRGALQRIKERCLPDAHASYYTKHSSHSRYSKGW